MSKLPRSGEADLNEYQQVDDERRLYLLAFPATFDDAPLDFRRVIAFLRAEWPLVLVCGFVCACGAYLASFAFPERYRATVVVMPADDAKGAGALGGLVSQFGGLASLAGLSLGSAGSNRAEALATLRSREFTRTFIAKHDLLPLLFSTRWDARSKAWKVPEAKVPTLERAIDEFDEKVRLISENRTAGTVAVSIEWTDGEIAARWANELINDLNSYARERAILESEKSLKFLYAEALTTASLETRQAIYKLVESQINQRMLANVRSDYAFRVIDVAVPPDARRTVSPKRTAFALAGLVLGVALGLGLATVRRTRRSARGIQ